MQSITKQQRKNLQLIYQDDYILAICKPAGVLSIPDRYDSKIWNMYNYLQHEIGKVYTVHRLDKATSGLMLFAKTPDAHRYLSIAFQERQVQKTYQLIAHGHFLNPSGSINLPIGKHPTQKGTMVIDKNQGKPATTNYQVLTQFKQYAHVQAKPLTGRTHQIRVHCQAIGHPIIADNVYSTQNAFYLSTIKPKYNISKHQQERPLLNRMALHAHQLTFKHPITQAVLQLEAPLPKDMAAVLRQLKKWASINNL